jgi:hypothetical protein
MIENPSDEKYKTKTILMFFKNENIKYPSIDDDDNDKMYEYIKDRKEIISKKKTFNLNSSMIIDEINHSNNNSFLLQQNPKNNSINLPKQNQDVNNDNINNHQYNQNNNSINILQNTQNNNSINLPNQLQNTMKNIQRKNL